MDDHGTRKLLRSAFVLTIAALFLSGCASSSPLRDTWYGKDKAYHFVGSALIAGGVTAIALDQDASDTEAMAWGVCITVPLGMGKEAYDAKVKKTFWSWKDLAWDVAGAFGGSLLVVSAD